MIPLSYDNVMNGFNKGIHMRGVLSTRQEATWIFQRALDLWYIEGTTLVDKNRNQLMYGPTGDQISLHFWAIGALDKDQWQGFRGIYLIHPDIELLSQPTSVAQKLLPRLDEHNTRYLEQWRA